MRLRFSSACFRFPSILGIALLLTSALGAGRLEAQQADVVRGQVIRPDSMPVEGAKVTVTSMAGQVSRNARSDKDGASR